MVFGGVVSHLATRWAFLLTTFKEPSAVSHRGASYLVVWSPYALHLREGEIHESELVSLRSRGSRMGDAPLAASCLLPLAGAY